MTTNSANLDRDVLISRVIDGVATQPEWAALEELAAADTGVWRELALAQRDAARLALAVGNAVAPAEHCELPDHAPLRLEEAHVRFARTARTWLGWAAAAVIAAAFLVVNRGGPIGPADAPITAGLSGGIAQAPDEHLARYISAGQQAGTVLGEVPQKVLLEAQPVVMEGGRQAFEVVFVRQIVERSRVDDLYTFSTRFNELGQPTTVKPQPVRIVNTSRNPM